VLTIASQPARDTRENDILQVDAAGGTLNYTYQWYKGQSGDTSNPIKNATASQYFVPQTFILPKPLASFWVRVTDSANGTTGRTFVDSTTSAIKVFGPVIIVTPPIGATIDAGQTDTLSVT